jgi:hypothetical protein
MNYFKYLVGSRNRGSAYHKSVHRQDVRTEPWIDLYIHVPKGHRTLDPSVRIVQDRKRLGNPVILLTISKLSHSSRNYISYSQSAGSFNPFFG